MNTNATPVVPYGLFRYLYNSYQVRYPDYYMFIQRMLPPEAVDFVGGLQAKDLEAHLATQSWLIGLERPDLSESVQALWNQMTARSRGDYLAGFYCKDSPIEWVKEQLSELLGLLPIGAKPIFHSPHAMGGFYYTLLELVWDDSEKLAFAEEIGMDLSLTEYEVARIIQRREYATFCALVGRLGESLMNEALARVQEKWPNFSTNKK